ncbi:hypothetical protein AKJ16_DCAP18317 [Drosera capensis]
MLADCMVVLMLSRDDMIASGAADDAIRVFVESEHAQKLYHACIKVDNDTVLLKPWLRCKYENEKVKH